MQHDEYKLNYCSRKEIEFREFSGDASEWNWFKVTKIRKKTKIGVMSQRGLP